PSTHAIVAPVSRPWAGPCAALPWPACPRLYLPSPPPPSSILHQPPPPRPPPPPPPSLPHLLSSSAAPRAAALETPPEQLARVEKSPKPKPTKERQEARGASGPPSHGRRAVERRRRGEFASTSSVVAPPRGERRGRRTDGRGEVEPDAMDVVVDAAAAAVVVASPAAPRPRPPPASPATRLKRCAASLLVCAAALAVPLFLAGDSIAGFASSFLPGSPAAADISAASPAVRPPEELADEASAGLLDGLYGDGRGEPSFDATVVEVERQRLHGERLAPPHLTPAEAAQAEEAEAARADRAEEGRRNLRFAFFGDPKTVELKDAAVGAHRTDGDGGDNVGGSFHALTAPSSSSHGPPPPPLPFHLDPNDSASRCDDVVLFLPDTFSGHGIGSQLNSYLIAALIATRANRAMVMLGESEFLAGCPEDVLVKDERTEKAKNNYELHFSDARDGFPKSLERLIDHPSWLSRNCPVPCQDTHTMKDWKDALKKGGPLPEVACDTRGRETNVLVLDGYKTIQDKRAKESTWIDRTTDRARLDAYNWALRLGGDVDEASIFASLDEREEILDYLLALGARTGWVRFQPWIARDVEAYVSSIEGDAKPFLNGGEYAGVHVRRGDKLAHEAKAFVDDYWRRFPDEDARNYIPLRQYLAQFEVHREIEELPKDEDGASKLTEDNNCLKFRFSFGPPPPGNHYHNLSFKRGLCTNLYQTIVASVADLTLLARSETFVGEYNSNWGRVVRAFRLVVNDVAKVREGGERAALERDTRIAWGNKRAKYVWSWDWNAREEEGARLLPGPASVALDAAPEEEEARVAAVVDGDGGRRRNLLLDPKSVVLKGPQANDNFYIDIGTFREGFSGWKVTLGQVMAMIDTIPGATFVEPCMINGRARSCTTPYPEDLLAVEGGASYAPVPISEIFDMTWALQPRDGRPPLMVLYEDFARRIQQPEKPVKEFPVCLRASQSQCPKPFTQGMDGRMKASAKNDAEISVYTIYTCWWGRCALELSRNFKGVGDRNMSLPRAPVNVHPRLVDTVKEVLAKANIGSEYSLIHWRGENKRIDYIECAETVVRAKDNMSKTIQQQQPGDQNQHPFILMTSLNEDPKKQWNGESIANIASNGTPKEALSILESNGFIRFDKLLRNANVPVKDPGMLGLYELILATLSRNFSTCAYAPAPIPGQKGSGIPQGCSKEQFGVCNHCNYIGKFARLALDMRIESGRHDESSTMACWPV
ncbi:hypothetical protein ACHAWF_017375, partial [Thalassiosira exigua]